MEDSPTIRLLLDVSHQTTRVFRASADHAPFVADISPYFEKRYG